MAYELTDSLVKIGAPGARVESGDERGELSLEHEVVVPGAPRAAAARRAAYRLQGLFLHQ